MKAVMNLKVPVSIFKEGKTFIAYSPVLDLSTSGKSFVIVQRRFAELSQVFFEELIQMGTLEEVLTGLGWQKINRQWTAPLPIAHEVAEVSVPLTN